MSQAGQCGTLNGFNSLNLRLAALGKENPFAACKQAKEYPNLAAAKADLTTVGEKIMVWQGGLRVGCIRITPTG